MNNKNFFCQVGFRDLQERGRELLAAETEPRAEAEIRPPAGLRGRGRHPLHVRREPRGQGEQERRRQQNTDLERVLVMEIRKTQILEKSSDPMAALAFLQTEVSICVNHENKEELWEFQDLASQVFSQVRRSVVASQF